jgi:hypothetical protein
VPSKKVMPKKDLLVEAAKRAIDNVFGDVSVSKEKTVERMEELLDAVQGPLQCLRADIRRERGERT